MQFLKFGLFEDGSKGGFYVPVDDKYGVKISSINEGFV